MDQIFPIHQRKQAPTSGDGIGQDQGLLARDLVRLGADVALAIEEEHPQQLAGGIQEMHRDDADRAGAA